MRPHSTFPGLAVSIWTSFCSFNPVLRLFCPPSCSPSQISYLTPKKSIFSGLQNNFFPEIEANFVFHPNLPSHSHSFFRHLSLRNCAQCRQNRFEWQFEGFSIQCHQSSCRKTRPKINILIKMPPKSI